MEESPGPMISTTGIPDKIARLIGPLSVATITLYDCMVGRSSLREGLSILTLVPSLILSIIRSSPGAHNTAISHSFFFNKLLIHLLNL